jgi:hypothetical protein
MTTPPDLHARDIDYLRSANRKCGLSYRSSCRRSSGIDTAKALRDRGLLYLHDKGEKCSQGRFIWRTTDAGKKLMEKLK